MALRRRDGETIGEADVLSPYRAASRAIAGVGATRRIPSAVSASIAARIASWFSAGLTSVSA